MQGWSPRSGLASTLRAGLHELWSKQRADELAWRKGTVLKQVVWKNPGPKVFLYLIVCLCETLSLVAQASLNTGHDPAALVSRVLRFPDVKLFKSLRSWFPRRM